MVIADHAGTRCVSGLRFGSRLAQLTVVSCLSRTAPPQLFVRAARAGARRGRSEGRSGRRGRGGQARWTGTCVLVCLCPEDASPSRHRTLAELMEDIASTCFYRVEVRVGCLPASPAPQLTLLPLCCAGLVDV